MLHTVTKGSLVYRTADALEGSIHCFSTRLGGVSEGALRALNLGTGRGDSAQNVRKNYEILGKAVGFSPEDTVFTRQVHTDVIRTVTEQDRGVGLLRPQEFPCDALITNRPGVALCCFTADCVPILLFDPVKRAVAAVHAGWRGTALAIARKTVLRMQSEFGCRPQDIRAAIGPHIAPCHFLTDADVPDAMKAAFGSDADGFITKKGEKFAVDLGGINAYSLRSVGVQTIDLSDTCTACHPDELWSHRVVGAARGTLAGIIMLK